MARAGRLVWGYTAGVEGHGEKEEEEMLSNHKDGLTEITVAELALQLQGIPRFHKTGQPFL